jgi:hypothetical protein
MEFRDMKLFTRKHETPTTDRDDIGFWPQDRLDDIDDDAFAQAIAAGRLAEQEHEHLVPSA